MFSSVIRPLVRRVDAATPLDNLTRMTWTAGDGPGPAFGSRRRRCPPVDPRRLHPQARASAACSSRVLVGAGAARRRAGHGLGPAAIGRPEAIAIGLVLAVLPVGPLVACYLWLDRYEPEPVRLLVLAFAWGALVATGARWSAADRRRRSSTARRGLVGGRRRADHRGGGQGHLRAAAAVVATPRHRRRARRPRLRRPGRDRLRLHREHPLLRRRLHAAGPTSAPAGSASATALFVLRGVFSPFAHPLFTSAIGIGVGIAVSTRSPAAARRRAGGRVRRGGAAARRLERLGLPRRRPVLRADLPVRDGPRASWCSSGLAIWFRVREGGMLARSMTDLARQRLPPPRRGAVAGAAARAPTARANAALRGGPRPGQLMRDYQQQAIELAALHDRVLRGTAPPDFAAPRGR